MRLIIFDCDGTIVDSQLMIVATMKRAFETLGLEPPTREQTLSIIGRSLHEAMRDLTDDDHPIEEMVQAYRASFVELRDDPRYEEPLYDGAKECLMALHARDDVLLGIATGKSRRGVDAIIELHDLHNLFATIQTADMAPSKPHPGMVYQALEETGLDAADAVIIGDTSFDMAMGKAAGITSLGVEWGYHDTPTLLRAGADKIFSTYADLQTYLMADLSQKRAI
ncbi:MAG: HAD family hydrolase [Hyphomicrobiales bacterium]|nr:MAG: HAD family hydrolase [Hyphomicrobiales bacterium]